MKQFVTQRKTKYFYFFNRILTDMDEYCQYDPLKRKILQENFGFVSIQSMTVNELNF
jgi:hypothetical protein